MRLHFLTTLPCLLALSCHAIAADKTIYGLNEHVSLDIDVQVAAKLDTGAQTASLSARDIERFKRCLLYTSDAADE